MSTEYIPTPAPTPSRTGLLGQLGGRGWSRLLVAVGVVCIHMLFGHEDYNFYERLLAGSCGVLTVTVIWSYFSKQDRGLPVLEWVVLQLYVFFAMPIFFEGESLSNVNFQYLSRSGAIFQALVAANLFIVCLFAGWLLIRKRKETKSRATSIRQVQLSAVIVYGLLSLVISYLLAKFEYEIADRWYRFPLFVLFSPIIAQILLLFELHVRPKGRRIWLLIWLFTGFMVVQGLLRSRLDYALPPLITVGIGLLVAKQKIPKLLVVVILAMLLVFNPAKLIYRSLTGLGTAEFGSLSVGQMADAWMRSIEEIWGQGEKTREKAFEKTASRLNNISINAAIINSVPDRVPYALGEPWVAIPVSVVPRFFWTEKPDITNITNDKFNVLFGMTTWKAAESSTSAYPAVADGFWNFGWIGVALVGFLAGLFWKSLYNIWTPTGRTRYTFVFVLLTILRAPSAFPNLVIGIVQTAIACIVVVKTMELIGTIGRDGRSGT
jgi:hypothetical protein